jgi:vitamin B12 transporter
MKKIILSFIVFFTVLSLNAQTTIKGKIKNTKGKGIKGISIAIKDSYDGTLSDSLGNFEFKTTEKGEKIVEISGSGYVPLDQNINIDKETIEINVSLKKTINELEAVTITAGSFEANDKKRAAILKPLDIVTTAGSNADISATLQTMPGAQRVGESEGLFIRGGSAEESKIIIDGTVVNNFFFTSVPGIAQRGRFSPFLFSSTAFSTGGYSALYGQALSAVLNLESVDLPQATEIQAGISPIFGMLGFQQLSKNKKSSWGSSTSYSNLTFYMKLVPQKQEFFKAPTSNNFDVNYRIKLKKGIIKFYSYYNTSGLSLRSNSLDSVGLKNMFGLKNANFFSNLSWKHLLKNNWKIYSVASFSYNDDKIENQMQNSLNEKLPYTGNSLYDNASFKIRSFKTMSQFKSIIEKKLKGLSSIRFGGEIWYNEDKNDYEFEYYKFNTKIDEQYSAGFIESDIYVSNKFAIRPGLRYEYTNLTAKSNFAPRLSASYQLAQPTQISFDYGIFYQTPGRNFLINQTDFNFSRADHYILTFQHLTKEYILRSQLFYKSYSNLLKTDVTNRIATSMDGRGYAQGFEIFWRDKKTIKGLDYWISYSYLDTKRDFMNYPIYSQPTFATAHTGSFVLKKFWTKRMFGINWSYNWATGRPYYNPNRPQDEYLKDRTPFYHSNNFSFNWIKFVKKTTAVFFIGINNVFNQKQIYGYSYSNVIKDSSGDFIREELGPPARMSFFIGIFASWGVDRSQQNIDNNL